MLTFEYHRQRILFDYACLSNYKLALGLKKSAAWL